MSIEHISQHEYDRHEFERAIYFLSDALRSSGRNKKPVLLHSIQVAEMLWDKGISQDAVVAAILHDVIEDTGTTLEEINDTFGVNVGNYVNALTLGDDISIKRSFELCDELGVEALVIRAADLIQNSYYYTLAPVESRPDLKQKFKYFLDTYGKKIDKIIGPELKAAYLQNVENL